MMLRPRAPDGARRPVWGLASACVRLPVQCAGAPRVPFSHTAFIAAHTCPHVSNGTCALAAWCLRLCAVESARPCFQAGETQDAKQTAYSSVTRSLASRSPAAARIPGVTLAAQRRSRAWNAALSPQSCAHAPCLRVATCHRVITVRGRCDGAADDNEHASLPSDDAPCQRQLRWTYLFQPNEHSAIRKHSPLHMWSYCVQSLVGVGISRVCRSAFCVGQARASPAFGATTRT